MNILGVNSYFEHPAVALIVDGRLVFAAEDERFTRIKHGKRYNPHRTYWPVEAMWAALQFCDLHARDIDEIAYSYNRWDHLKSLWGCLTGRRISSLSDELAAFRSLRNMMPALCCGYEIPERYRNRLSPEALEQIRYREWNHHRAHAASTFYCSSFDRALVIVSDGAGENECTSIYIGQDWQLQRIAKMTIPHSLGLFYSFITRHLGFEPFSDEYKVMALAAYGKATFSEKMSQIVHLLPEGKYRVDARRIRDLRNDFGPARHQSEPLIQYHKDIARSAQEQLELTLLHIIRHHVRSTGMRRLCLAGGTFLNCVANRRIAVSGLVDDIFVQPAAHDAGTAIGAAALSLAEYGFDPRVSLASVGLGTSYADDAIERALCKAKLAYLKLSESEIILWMAKRLAQGQVGALFRGRMEFGPRALGMRSIIASPVHPQMLDRLNRAKGREAFRPVAPMVTAEAYSKYFDGYPSRYMSFVVDVRQEMRTYIPAVVHIDGSARVQVVSSSDDPFLHELLIQFSKLSGVPVLINTSLNVCGEPIIESPRHAITCLFISDIDFLVAGGFAVEKKKDF